VKVAHTDIQRSTARQGLRSAVIPIVMSKVPTMGMRRWAMASLNPSAWKNGTHPSFTRIPKAPWPMKHMATPIRSDQWRAREVHAGREVMDAEVGSMAGSWFRRSDAPRCKALGY
jgi:hypothetical protein